MIGQVATLRDRGHTLAELHAEVSDGSTELLEAGRESPVVADAEHARPPADVAIVGMACDPSRRRRPARVLGEHPQQGRRDHRGPGRPLGLAAYYDPDPEAADKINSKMGRVHRRRPVRPARVRHAAQLAALDRAAPAADARARPVRRWTTPATPTGRSPASGRRSSSAPAAAAADLDRRLRLPVVPARLFGSTMPAELTDERWTGPLPEWTEDSFPGILLNVAAGRVANRFDLGGSTTRSTPPAARRWPRSTWLSASWRRHQRRGDRRAAPTRSRTRSPTCASARPTRSPRPAAAAPSTPTPTASRSARASPPSSSSGWPTPSATATASTP